MKKLSFFVSAFALCASTSYAAINCGTLPTCASLGYSDTASQCPKSVNGEEMVVKCPFDTSMGKCIYEAAVGQIAYFSKAPNSASGWLLCDGKSYSYTKYPQLAKLIGTQFGGTVNNTFMVPDYRGFFLRVYAYNSTSSYTRSDFSDYAKGAVNNSFTTPQEEGLPNITGSFAAVNQDHNPSEAGRGAITLSDIWSTKISGGGKNDTWGRWYGFSASESNTIYGNSSGVTPPNMAVYAYIYAGKIVQ